MADPRQFGGTAVVDPSQFGGVPHGGMDHAESIGQGYYDERTGAPFLERAAASFKMTPAGKVGYLESVYGKGNVEVLPSGELAYLHPQSQRWTLFDERGLGFGDVADFAGDVPGVVGTTIGAAAGTAAAPGVGTVAGAGAGAGVGNLAKQGISAMIPGDDAMSVPQRVGSVALDTALGAGTQYGVNKAVQLFDKVRPHNVVARSVQKSLDTPYAQQGETLAQQTGIPLSLGQQTGSRTQLALEGFSRRNPASADLVSAFDDNQLRAAVTRLDGIMNQARGAQVGDLSYGIAVNDAYSRVLDRALGLRRVQAARDFGAVRQVAGDRPVIDTANARAELDDLVKQFDVPGGGDATASLVKRLKELKTGLEPKGQPQVVNSPVLGPNGLPITSTTVYPQPKALTADQTRRLLQIYTDAAAGKGTLFENIDKAQQRMIAGKLKDALLRDLDDAATAGGTPGKVADALKTARDNYRANSGAIDNLHDSVLGRYFNTDFPRTPERVADMVTKMKPSEISQTLQIIERGDPQTVAMTRRYFIERAMDAAKPAPSQAKAAGVQFSPAKFLSALPDENALAAIYGNSVTGQDLRNVARILTRVADRGGTEGSPTAPLMMAWDLAKGLFTLNPRAIAGIPTAVIAPRAIAQAALTPQGRRAVATLASTGVRAKAATEAIAYLTALEQVGSSSATNSPNMRGLARATGAQSLQ